MVSKEKLSAESWIRAAFRALAADGVQGIKAERIARSLAVSKGSFYWHFKNIHDLSRAMIAHWQEAATTGVITAVEAEGGDGPTRLRRLTTIMTADLDQPYGGPGVEPAIREWARATPFVGKAVAQTDGTRLDYVTGLFREAGHKDSAQAARILYATSMGLNLLAQAGRDSRAADLSVILDVLLRDDRPG